MARTLKLSLERHSRPGLGISPCSMEALADIEEILMRRAQNMFLYASLVLTQLCDKNKLDDEHSIRVKLEALPKDITGPYNHIMVEVHDDKSNSKRSCRIAQETFKWLLYAREPLQHDALLEAVSPPECKVDSDCCMLAGHWSFVEIQRSNSRTTRFGSTLGALIAIVPANATS